MIPLTKTNIDIIMGHIFNELYQFSYSLAHAKIKAFAPPFLDYLNGDKDIIQYLNDLFNRYYSKLSKLKRIDWVNNGLHEIIKHCSNKEIDFNLSRDAKILGDAILASLEAYYEGLPSKAFQILQNVFLQNDRHFINMLPLIEATAMKGFRVREGSHYNKITDLFHIPFELRHKCSSYRFSILGFPSLYLAESLPTALNEVRAKSDNDFCITQYEYNGEIALIDLALIPRQMQLWEIYSQLMFYPLIAACGLKVKNENSPFKPEYVIPQLFFQIVKMDMPEFAGVSYISTRSANPDFTDMRQRNYVLFVPETSLTKGYSSQLAEKLTACDPICIKYNDDIKTLIQYEVECALRPKKSITINSK